MTDAPILKPPSHLNYLDSARGIAALLVAGGHFIPWVFGQNMTAKVLDILFNGVGAVSFFFVLSGFVLSYKYIVLNKALDLGSFYVNRLFRLWPAFFVTVVLCHVFDLTRFDITWQKLADTFVFDKSSFWEEAILIWSRTNLYGPGWTLVLELKGSLFLPFIILLAKKDIRYLFWLAFVFYLLTFWFLVFFILGVFISSYFTRISNSEFRKTKCFKYRHLILVVAIVLYSVDPINKISPLGPDLIYLILYLLFNFYYTSAIGAFVFIIMLLNSSNAKKILSINPLLFMGKISYSTYLVHWMLVGQAFIHRDALMNYFQNETQAAIVVFATYITSTIILATIMHYTVELPFIRMGKRITGKMRPYLKIQG